MDAAVIEREVARVTNYVEWGFITDAQAVKAVARFFNDRDALGNKIEVGGKFWNNDLKVVTILPDFRAENDHRSPDGVAIWWATSGGSFDGSRLARVHPSTREVAA
jgi:hypothetical protein